MREASDAGADGGHAPSRTPGRRGADHTNHVAADLLARCAAAAAHWQAILGLAVLLWIGGTAVGNWIGWHAGPGPGQKLAEIQAAQLRSDSLRVEGFRQLGTRMDRVERMVTQQTLGQCMAQKRGAPDAWATCNRELRETLSQLSP